MGLDLSTRAAAAVAVPSDWDGQWNRVASLVVGEPLRRDASDAERAARTETIARRIVGFAQSHGVREAWIESYAFNQSVSAHTLGEVGGVVRLELVRAGMEIRTAQMATARKLLLGKVPRSGAKDAVVATLKAAGARFETADEYDAFTAVNLGLATIGAVCLCQEAA